MGYLYGFMGDLVRMFTWHCRAHEWALLLTQELSVVVPLPACIIASRVASQPA